MFGDLDGVLIVPRATEEEIFTCVLEKARSEKIVKQAIKAGTGAAEAFQKFGIM